MIGKSRYYITTYPYLMTHERRRKKRRRRGRLCVAGGGGGIYYCVFELKKIWVMLLLVGESTDDRKHKLCNGLLYWETIALL